MDHRPERMESAMSGYDSKYLLKPASRLLLLLIVTYFAGPGYADTVTVKIGGSGGPLAGMRVLAEAYKKAHPDARVTVVANLGSSGGIKAVVAGAIDVAVSSRPLKPAEIEQGVVGIEYARAAFVFATSRKAPTAGMTLSQLAGVYRGDITAWPDGQRLRLILRPEHDSASATLRKISPEMNDAISIAQKRPGLVVAPTDDDSIEAIDKTPGSLGTITLAQLVSEKRRTTPLAVDGVKPSVKTLAEGKYPVSVTFYLAVNSLPNPSVQRFIAFVQSKSGQAVLARSGHWVAPKASSRDGVTF